MATAQVFLPGESQGRGSLVGCPLWGRTELDTTEVTQQQQQQVPVWITHLSSSELHLQGFHLTLNLIFPLN